MDDKTEVDVLAHNRQSWNEQSRGGDSPWCQPADVQTIAQARAGQWEVILTPLINVPKKWFGEIRDKRVLCLASGGGQQVPILSAAGAHVTSFDNSDEQLAKDKLVADREGLDIKLVQGDMTDLSQFQDGQFDLIFHPISNIFAQDVRTVWRECYRVLVDEGRLLSGFMNPDYYLFDHDALDAGEPAIIRHKLPYSDLDNLSENELKQHVEKQHALEFSHSLDEQIGGQIEAGFIIAGFYEDRWSDEATPLNAYMPTSMATLAIKDSGVN
ncbi:MAG: class I SAM-dependent methyltransferase [Pseudomonadota bacterium]